MLPSAVYRAENIDIARRVHIALAALSVLFCGYFLAALTLDVRELWQAERSLCSLRANLVGLRKQAARRMEAELPAVGGGGVEVFAVRAAKWADTHNVHIESLVPEGLPTVVQAQVAGTSLGMWKATKFKLTGRGQFERVMALLDELCTTHMLVQLESFSLEAVDGGADGAITFELALTVHEESTTS